MVFLLIGVVSCEPKNSVETSNTCSGVECEIVLQHVVTLSDAVQPGLLSNLASFSFHRDTRGRFLVPALKRDMFIVFDSMGHLITTVGRAGAGPAEFRRVMTPIRGPGDTLYVPDRQLGRVSIFDPGLSFVRMLPAPYVPSLVQHDGSFIIAQQVSTIDRSGYPIHVAGRDLNVLRSFGTDTPQYRPDLRLLMTRLVAPGRDGTIWAIAPGRYTLERWDPHTGERIAVVAIRSSWFRETPNHAPLDKPPGSIVEGLWEDKTGLVWLLARVTDLDWRPIPDSPERPWTSEDYDGRNDWILEVVEPNSGSVVAHKRFPSYLRQFPPTPLLVSSRDSANLIVVFDIWKPVLQPAEVRK